MAKFQLMLERDFLLILSIISIIITSAYHLYFLINYFRKQVISRSVSHSVMSNSLTVDLSHSSVHGISQARILEWAAISFSRG